MRNLLLGVTVLFLARTQGALYFMNNIKDDTLFERSRKQVLVNGIVFVLFFLSFVTATLLATGYETNPLTGEVFPRAYKYFHNLIEMPWVAFMFLVGVVLVLYALIRSVFGQRYTRASNTRSSVPNKKETTLAQQKQQAIKDALWQLGLEDPQRRETLVKQYNELFNSTRLREYDGSHIHFVG